MPSVAILSNGPSIQVAFRDNKWEPVNRAGLRNDGQGPSVYEAGLGKVEFARASAPDISVASTMTPVLQSQANHSAGGMNL